MTIVQLEYVVAVDTHGSFSIAAEECCVTQPTLSMQIQKLEEELGITIFDRSKKPIKATPIGEEIVRQAQSNLQGMRRIKEIIQEQADEIKGQLRIGIIPTVAPYLLPLFVKDFLSKYPLVNLSIEELVSEQIIQKLKQDLLDAGILVTPLENKSILEIPLFYETFVAYMSTTHPLIHHDSVELKDLNINEMLLLSEGHCFRNQVVNICPENRERASSNQLRFESGSLETLKRIIENDFGYTLLPELAVLNLPEEKQKYLRELTYPKPVREVSLATHRGILKRNLIEALKDQILEKIPEQLKDRNRGKIISWR
jgi:LysR family hydrogen peroxide-inducible transcriptional activator